MHVPDQAKGLADRVGDDPPTIRLRFRHKSVDQRTGKDAFYSERKANCCVACGGDRNYLRYKARALRRATRPLSPSAVTVQALQPEHACLVSTHVCDALSRGSGSMQQHEGALP